MNFESELHPISYYQITVEKFQENENVKSFNNQRYKSQHSNDSQESFKSENLSDDSNFKGYEDPNNRRMMMRKKFGLA